MELEDEIARGREAKRIKKFMKEHFDEQSDALFAQFVNTDPKEVETLQFLVIHHKVLMDEQQFIDTAIDTAKLAQIELDKTEK